jgi:hypothetical protein
MKKKIIKGLNSKTNSIEYIISYKINRNKKNMDQIWRRKQLKGCLEILKDQTWNLRWGEKKKK